MKQCDGVSAKECKCTVCSVRLLFKRKGYKGNPFTELTGGLGADWTGRNAGIVGNANKDIEDKSVRSCNDLVDFNVDTGCNSKFMNACTFNIPTYEPNSNLLEGFTKVMEYNKGGKIPPKAWNFFVNRFAEHADENGEISNKRWEKVENEYGIAPAVTVNERRRLNAAVPNALS